MPTLLIWRDYRFRFYSSDRTEPPHVHIQEDGRDAKIWLHGLDVSFNHGYNERELQKLIAKVAEHRNGWIGSWNEYFGI